MPSDQSPVVSIVVPTYNRAQMLEQVIQCVRSQTVPDWECLVVDDASTDDIESVVLAAGDERIRYLRRPVNGGVSAAQNTGIDNAHGRFIVFLHTDDLIDQDYVEKQLAQLEGAGNEKLAGIECARKVISAEGLEVLRPRLAETSDLRMLQFEISVHITQILFKSAVLREVHFDESLRGWEDWDLFYRLIKADYRFATNSEALCTINQHDGPRLSAFEVQIEQLLKLHEKYIDDIKPSRLVHGVWHFKIGLMYARMGIMSRARKHFMRSAILKPTDFARVGVAASAFLGRSIFGLVWHGYERARRIRYGGVKASVRSSDIRRQ